MNAKDLHALVKGIGAKLVLDKKISLSTMLAADIIINAALAMLVNEPDEAQKIIDEAKKAEAESKEVIEKCKSKTLEEFVKNLFEEIEK